MSTRYVWKKCKVAYDVTRSTTTVGSISGTNTTALAPISASDYTVTNIDGVAYFNPIGGSAITFSVGTSTNSRTWAVSGDRQCVFNQSGYIAGKGYRTMYLAPHDSVEWSAAYIYSGSGFGTVSITSYPAATGSSRWGQLATAVATPKAGGFIEYVSSSSNTTYPSNGASGEYWYEYVGSDSIDPVAISYPSAVSFLGTSTPFQYTITPSSSNLYGGNISYTISYSKNGESWVDDSSWSTETSGDRYIADNTWKTYRLRVRARDNYGFTSTTWIQGITGTVTPDLALSLSVSPAGSGEVDGGGAYFSGTKVTVKATPANGWEFVAWQENSATVSTSASYTFTITASRTLTAVFKQKLRLWVGVDGKARKGVGMWIGVNGKARKVVGAWVGVDGKARRFL